MNKTELIAAAADKAGLSKKDTEKAVTAALDAITEALVKGDKVQLVGFGAFEVAHRPQSADQGRDQDPRVQGSGLQGRQGAEGCRS